MYDNAYCVVYVHVHKDDPYTYITYIHDPSLHTPVPYVYIGTWR